MAKKKKAASKNRGKPMDKGEQTFLLKIGKRITKLREDKEWSVEYLADKIGVSGSTQWRRETGKFGSKIIYIRQYAKAFGITCSDFMQGID